MPVSAGDGHSLLIEHDIADQLKFFCERRLLLGQWQGTDCQVWELSPEAKAATDFKLVELRSLLASSGDEEFTMACRAVQLLDWQHRHQFCGTCGSQMFWDGLGDNLSIFAGCFDGATGVMTSGHIFCADKGDYYEITGGLPQADVDGPALTAQFYS